MELQEGIEPFQLPLQFANAPVPSLHLLFVVAQLDGILRISRQIVINSRACDERRVISRHVYL
jgi:hypothetical protein